MDVLFPTQTRLRLGTRDIRVKVRVFLKVPNVPIVLTDRYLALLFARGSEEDLLSMDVLRLVVPYVYNNTESSSLTWLGIVIVFILVYCNL